MPKPHDQPISPVEVTWIVCERCGALGPRFERSRGIEALEAQCCSFLAIRGAALHSVCDNLMGISLPESTSDSCRELAPCRALWSLHVRSL